VHIAQELAAKAGVEFGGALLRSHADLIWEEGKPTEKGQVVLEAVRRAGNELIASGSINRETLIAAGKPLCDQEEYRLAWNRSSG